MVSRDEFIFNLTLKLEDLTWKQKIHTINRLYEKLRQIHNAVGDVYAKRKTIQQFKKEYPVIFEKLKPHFAPYVEGNYLSEKGWHRFLAFVFDPLHDGVTHWRTRLVAKIRTFTPEQKDLLVQQGILVAHEDPDGVTRYSDNKMVLRQITAEVEVDPFE